MDALERIVSDILAKIAHTADGSQSSEGACEKGIMVGCSVNIHDDEPCVDITGAEEESYFGVPTIDADAQTDLASCLGFEQLPKTRPGYLEEKLRNLIEHFDLKLDHVESKLLMLLPRQCEAELQLSWHFLNAYKLQSELAQWAEKITFVGVDADEIHEAGSSIAAMHETARALDNYFDYTAQERYDVGIEVVDHGTISDAIEAIEDITNNAASSACEKMGVIPYSAAMSACEIVQPGELPEAFTKIAATIACGSVDNEDDGAGSTTRVSKPFNPGEFLRSIGDPRGRNWGKPRKPR